MGNIILVLIAALAIGGLLTAFCFGLFSAEKERETCRDDCDVCPEHGFCSRQDIRLAEADMSERKSA